MILDPAIIFTIILIATAIYAPDKPNAISLIYDTKSPIQPDIPYNEYNPEPSLPPMLFASLPAVKTIPTADAMAIHFATVIAIAGNPNRLPVNNINILIIIKYHSPTS